MNRFGNKKLFGWYQKFIEEQPQILRLTTPKLKSVWGPFAQDDSMVLAWTLGNQTLEVGGPSWFVVAFPIFHRCWVIQDFAICGVKVERTIGFPCYVGQLKHGDGYISD